MALKRIEDKILRLRSIETLIWKSESAKLFSAALALEAAVVFLTADMNSNQVPLDGINSELYLSC